MKNLLLTLALVTSMTFADTEGYEVPVGCLFNGTKGQCIVQNHFQRTVTCEVQTLGKTKLGMKVGNTKTLVIQSGKFDSTKVFSTDEDQFTDVSATANCK